MNPERITLDNPARAAIIAQIEQRGTTKPSKYRNEKERVDGFLFDSRHEARRYQALCLEQKAGLISGLTLQKSYPLTVNGFTVGHYIADFVYQRDGATVVEDAKSAHTKKLPVYRLKKKLMQAIYDINIIET